MEEADFYNRVDYLYACILLQKDNADARRIAEPKVILPNGDDVLECNFDLCMHEAARQINTRMGYAYVSVCYEGRQRWSLFGSNHANFLEFQILRSSPAAKTHARHLRVTRHLMGASFVQCSIHGDTKEVLMKDLKIAMRTIIGLSLMRPKNEA